jgi:hypothetical protein
MLGMICLLGPFSWSPRMIIDRADAVPFKPELAAAAHVDRPGTCPTREASVIIQSDQIAAGF